MELVDIDFNMFCGWKMCQDEFSLSTPEFGGALFLLSQKKNWKIRKMKFDIKIKFLKIKGTDYLIAKKDGALNELFKLILKLLPILLVFFISVLFLSIQPSLIKCNWVLIWAQMCKIKVWWPN